MSQSELDTLGLEILHRYCAKDQDSKARIRLDILQKNVFPIVIICLCTSQLPM